MSKPFCSRLAKSGKKKLVKIAPRKCGRFGCNYARLVKLPVGATMQTDNGFLIVKIEGWYCPICAGSYGN